MDPIKDYYHENWIEFLNNCKSSPDVIFRGQSNSHQHEEKPKNRWKITSNYQRELRQHQFLTFGFHESNSLKQYHHLYDIEPFKSLPNDLKIIEFLEVLQHYGFKTPLIDFTTDVLTALYFASIDLSAHQVSHNPFRNDTHVSIFELDTKVLHGLFEVQDVSNSILANTWQVLQDEKFYTELINTRELGQPFVYTVNQPNTIINKNVKLQSGKFILFDSLDDLKFEDWIVQQVEKNRIQLEKPVIKVHNISHEGIFMNIPPNCINLFAFLMHKKRIGLNLFADDLQGMKLDMNNESAIHTLKCVEDNSKCECLVNLRKLNLDV